MVTLYNKVKRQEVVSLRTTKRILNKIQTWEGNPMLVAGIYRLFTYIPWEDIPEKYRKFFDPKAEETWNDDLKNFKEENIKLDIDAESKAILRLLVTKNVTHSLGMIPIVLADAYVYGIGVAPLQGKLLKLIGMYKEFIVLDRDLAEQYAILSVAELLNEIISSVDSEFSFDLEDVTSKIMKEYNSKDKKAKKKLSVDAAINVALKNERKSKKKEKKRAKKTKKAN